MTIRLLKEPYDKPFKKLVNKSKAICIASAWITPNQGLKALMKQPKCNLRAIIGTSDYMTHDGCLEDIVSAFSQDSLRIVMPESELFHSKLYIFQTKKADIAWIGSADFTEESFAQNSELLLETDDKKTVAKLAEWFDNEWDKRQEQDVLGDLKKYKEERSKLKGETDNVTVPVEDNESQKYESSIEIVRFIPKQDRVRWERSSGVIEFVYASKNVESVPYASAEKALHVVLDYLAGDNEELLLRCERHKAFQVRHVNESEGISQLLAREERKSSLLEERARAGKLSQKNNARATKNQSIPKTLRPGWVLSNDIPPRWSWRMIRACCDLVDVQIQPETKGSIF